MGCHVRKYLKSLSINPLGTLLLMSIPIVYWFESDVVTFVLTKVFRWRLPAVKLFSLISSFLCVNSFGNFLMLVFARPVKTSGIKDGIYCKNCKMYQPAESRHCFKCKQCIIGRSHHCGYLSLCVGINNIRYYILGVTYCNIAICYCFFFNYYYIVYKTRLYPEFSTIVKQIFNKYSRLPYDGLIPWLEPWVVRLGYLTSALIVINIIPIVLLMWSGQSRVWQIIANSEKGKLSKIFGRRWFQAILYPFN